jgi:hypothetical protein
MIKKNVTLPSVVVLDEWTKEIDGYEFVFQIKRTSGGGRPTWYPITFWKKDDPHYNVGDNQPSRTQVEEEFAQSVRSYIEVHLKNG